MCDLEISHIVSHVYTPRFIPPSIIRLISLMAVLSDSDGKFNLTLQPSTRMWTCLAVELSEVALLAVLSDVFIKLPPSFL